jgi:RNA polymerase sigma-70 factor, ECF subfamily
MHKSGAAMEDFRAIDRCLAGEEQAFAELIERHKDVVYSLAYHMLGDATEAEDIAQEAFVKAYRSLAGFRREASFRNWLCRIAQGLCIDYLRAHRNERRQRESQLNFEPAAPGPEASFVAREEINQALQRIPAPFRAVLVLRHSQELSYQEIAEILHLPLGTIKTHLRRGRAALKNELEKLRQEEAPLCRNAEEA